MFNSFQLGFLKIRSQNTFINTSIAQCSEDFQFAVIKISHIILNVFLNFINLKLCPHQVISAWNLNLVFRNPNSNFMKLSKDAKA